VTVAYLWPYSLATDVTAARVVLHYTALRARRLASARVNATHW
jgi:hypothetical protein